MELNGWLWFEAQGERVIMVIGSELVTDGVHRLNEISVDICRAAPLQASSQQHLAGQGPRNPGRAHRRAAEPAFRENAMNLLVTGTKPRAEQILRAFKLDPKEWMTHIPSHGDHRLLGRAFDHVAIDLDSLRYHTRYEDFERVIDLASSRTHVGGLVVQF